jgi:hypothetical protein
VSKRELGTAWPASRDYSADGGRYCPFVSQGLILIRLFNVEDVDCGIEFCPERVEGICAVGCCTAGALTEGDDGRDVA